MGNKCKFIGLFMVTLLLLAACAGPKAITGGVLRDQIFSVEPRANGFTTLWMVHDDVGAYCTNDAMLITEAQQIFNSADPTAFISYRSVNANDPEYAWLGDLTGGGCAIEKTGTTVYLLTAVDTPQTWMKLHPTKAE